MHRLTQHRRTSRYFLDSNISHRWLFLLNRRNKSRINESKEGHSRKVLFRLLRELENTLAFYRMGIILKATKLSWKNKQTFFILWTNSPYFFGNSMYIYLFITDSVISIFEVFDNFEDSQAAHFNLLKVFQLSTKSHDPGFWELFLLKCIAIRTYILW